MKLIASGVANWAAIVRSPSFSRSDASTTTTTLPSRMSSIADSIDANGIVSTDAIAVQIVPRRLRTSVGKRLPDELRHVDGDVDADSVRSRAHLAGEGARDVVQPSVAVVVREMRGEADHLSPVLGIGTSVAAEVEHDAGALVRLDHALEVRNVGLV